jgi:acetyltransferase-like isoleucine patch superfamily enzyme
MAADDFKVKEIGQGKVPQWKQYAALTLGNINVLNLLKFELILLLCNGMPGALGLFLRSKLYPKILGQVGKKVVFGRNLTLRHPQKISIGSNVIIDDNCVLDAKGQKNTGITIGDNVFVGRNSILYCKNGDMNVEDKVNIGANCEIYSKGYLSIGQGTMIAAYSYIMCGGRYEYETNVLLSDQSSYSTGSTEIGKNCWLGSKSVVLDGVSIGDSAVIGAGAIVTKNVPAETLVMGVPAKVIRQLSKDSPVTEMVSP